MHKVLVLLIVIPFAVTIVSSQIFDPFFSNSLTLQRKEGTDGVLSSSQLKLIKTQW